MRERERRRDEELAEPKSGRAAEKRLVRGKVLKLARAVLDELVRIERAGDLVEARERRAARSINKGGDGAGMAGGVLLGRRC